jgi:hypothetical protein
MMKKALILIITALWIFGCENQEVSFPDFEHQTVYFPIQTPLRTLSLGEDRVDNSLDRELKFDIGVSIGGMYKNPKDWTVDYIIDNTLLERAKNGTGDSLFALPSEYYTLTPAGTALIPAGSFNGLIRVQLTEAFLDDPRALTGQYVIPLSIASSSADSILRGVPNVVNPDRRILADYFANMAAKDWTMFAVRFYNAYHGKYLHRGMDIRYENGVPLDTAVYSTRDMERNQIRSMGTTSKISTVTDFIGKNTSTDGKNAMELVFTNRTGDSGSIVINPVAGANFAVTGTGQFFNRAQSNELLLGNKYQSMYLNYSYAEGIYTHQVWDTLVFLDRDLRYEEFAIQIDPL